MSYYYFQDGITSAQYVLDSNAASVTMPDVTRLWNVANTYSDGAAITGPGSYEAGVISMTLYFKQGLSQAAFNANRFAVTAWIGQPKTNPLYFYVNTGTMVVGGQVYPVSKSGESYTNFRTSSEVTLTWQMVKGYFQRTTPSSVTQAITSTAMAAVSLTNSGVIRTTAVISFVPISTCTLIQVQSSTNYGFRLQGTFSSGHTYSMDCSTGIVTDNGVINNGILTSGSLFYLDPGANTLSVWAGPGTLTANWYERYI